VRELQNVVERAIIIADMLGITRKSLWEKRKKWEIPRER